MIPSTDTNRTVCKEIRATQGFWDRAMKWRSHFGSTTDSDTAKALINFAISELERQQNSSESHGGDNAKAGT